MNTVLHDIKYHCSWFAIIPNPFMHIFIDLWYVLWVCLASIVEEIICDIKKFDCVSVTHKNMSHISHSNTDIQSSIKVMPHESSFHTIT